MAYVVNLKRSAEMELEHLPTRIHNRIVDCLIYLKEDPRPAGTRKLSGREGYRLRVGSYRVLYVIDDAEKEVEVFSIAHRRDVYRQL